MRPFYTVITLVSTMLLVSDCQLLTTQTEVDSSDYVVYSTYLNHFQFFKNVPREDTVIIRDTTAIGPMDIRAGTPWSWQANNGDQLYENDIARCEEAHNQAWEPLFEDMKKQLYQPQLKLRPHFTVSYPTQVLSREQIRQRGERAGDRESTTYFIYRFSNIVYDSSKTRALFFSSSWCGGKCGRGELVMLKKENQHWVLIETFRLWIA